MRRGWRLPGAGERVPVRRLDDAGLAAVAAAITDPAVLARYRTKVATVPGSECLWWTGAVAGRSDRERTDGGGHGRFWYAPGRVIIAHRFAFAVMNGVDALAEARLLGHRCHNPLCQRIAPNHVVVSSAAQNRREWSVQPRLPYSPLADPRGPRRQARELRDLARGGPAAGGRRPRAAPGAAGRAADALVIPTRDRAERRRPPTADTAQRAALAVGADDHPASRSTAAFMRARRRGADRASPTGRRSRPRPRVPARPLGVQGADAVEPVQAVGQRGARGGHELDVGGVASGLEAEPVIVAGVVGHEDVVGQQGVGGGGADLVTDTRPRAGGRAGSRARSVASSSLMLAGPPGRSRRRGRAARRRRWPRR